jgi:uncharacterized protein with HEPN domain
VSDRTTRRIEHIAEAIANIRALLSDKGPEDLERDPFTRAAFERFLEIISEAARHLTLQDKARHSHLPWEQIADLGNHLRHAYHKVDASILWGIYLKDLEPLEREITSLSHV